MSIVARSLAIALILFALANPAAANSASRIVSTAPSLTELVFAAGAGAKLVAVSAYSDYPATARALPQVADAGGIHLEALLALKPDLVLVWASGTREADIKRLHALGIRTEAIGVAALDDVPIALRRIGALADTLAVAEVGANEFAARLRAAQTRYASATKISVFFEISRVPLMTINGKHFLSEALRVCGGENVFADAGQLVFEPSREALLLKNPQAVFYGANKNAPSAPRDNRIYAVLAAARLGNIKALDADLILRPGPRLMDAVDETCGALDRMRQKSNQRGL